MNVRGLSDQWVLAARRAGAALPRPIKQMLARAVSSGDQDAAELVEGWDSALVGGGAFDLPRHRAPQPPADEGVITLPAETALRVLLVTDTLDASGVEEFVSFLARGLTAQGCAVAVLIAGDDEPRPLGRLGQQLRDEGITVVSSTEADGADWIAGFSPDVVDSHALSLWPLRTAEALGVPAVLTLHGPHNIMGRTPGDVAASRAGAGAVIAVSEMVAAQYRAADPTFPADRVVAIGNPVDPARRAGIDRATVRSALGLDDQFLFLSLARHGVQKNSYGLVSAFAEVAAREPRAHLLVCGRVDDAAYTAQVVALRDRLGLAGRVHLRGNLDGAPALLQGADAFVLDSFFEGWSLSSLEALGSGVPCVLSDVGGAREQLTAGPERGVLVSNPLGDTPLSWDAISHARFRPQANRDELVQAMHDVATGGVSFATRDAIESDARARFGAQACIDAHLGVLREAASHGAVTVPVRKDGDHGR